MRTPAVFLLAVASVAAAPLVLIASPATAAPSCLGREATVVGTPGDDTLRGTNPLGEVVFLDSGNDTYNGTGGDDVVCGGAGRDKIRGAGGNDALSGGPGRDQLSGGEGNDIVRGNGGRDYIAEGAGDDRVDGGQGKDWLTYLFQSNAVQVSVGRGQVDGAGHDFYGGIETFEGSTKADTMNGSGGNDDLRGAGGADQINGAGGHDILFAQRGTVRGSSGNDFIHASGPTHVLGGAGADGIVLGAGGVRAEGGGGADAFEIVSLDSAATLIGGGTNNQLSFARFHRGVVVDVGRGKARWEGGSLSFGGIHNILGSRRADALLGSADTDFMDAGRGADVLRGRGGNDFLIGRSGFDRGYGESGWDICFTEVRSACER